MIRYKMSGFLLLLLHKARELYERVHTTKLMLFQQPLLSPQCKAHSLFREKKNTAEHCFGQSIISKAARSRILHSLRKYIKCLNRGPNNTVPIYWIESAWISGQLMCSNICPSLKWPVQFLKNRMLTRPACIILQATKANIKLGTWFQYQYNPM